MESDFDIERVLTKVRRVDRKRLVIVDDSCEKFLKSKLCLTRWAHMTLAERCLRIKKTRGVYVSAFRLRSFYHLNKITWKQAYSMKRAEYENLPRLTNERA